MSNVRIGLVAGALLVAIGGYVLVMRRPGALPSLDRKVTCPADCRCGVDCACNPCTCGPAGCAKSAF
ncbi:MAG TPA: hypothetical protein VJJ83_00570 [Candidatus Babeliales bacterium]|nr:hypothetical protein [Candidatus Babeliales bacterium]